LFVFANLYQGSGSSFRAWPNNGAFPIAQQIGSYDENHQKKSAIHAWGETAFKAGWLLNKEYVA
jgi:hypothetical protein